MFRLLVFLLVLACCAIPASATLTPCTTTSCFTTAATNQTFQNITFPSGSVGASYPDPTTGVVFSDNTNLVGGTEPSGWPGVSSLEATACATSGCVTTLTITLPTAVTSVSMDLGLQSFNGFQVTVSNTTGGFFTQNTESGGPNGLFFGFVSDSPFSTFTIATEDNVSNLTLDNIEVGTPSGGGGDAQTPEAATFLMIGCGLIMLHFGRRWLPRAS